MIDVKIHETKYEYDNMGWVVTIISLDADTVFYTHNEAGNSIQKTDAKRIATAYTYDLLNRLEFVE